MSADLSRREQEVLNSLLENLANKEIGNKLNISERTVKFHVSNLLSKFGVRRRADLILLCYQKRSAAP
jgi:DNA-binding NarL/FixJ family response regulator